MPIKEQTISVKTLSVILGLIALIGGGGFFSGQLVAQVNHHNDELVKMNNRLETIEKDLDYIKDKLILQKKLSSPLAIAEMDSGS